MLCAGAMWAQEPHSRTPRDTALSSVLIDANSQTHEAICTSRVIPEGFGLHGLLGREEGEEKSILCSIKDPTLLAENF